MTDTVTVAVITVGGMIVVAVASVVTQLLTTRFVVKAEQRKTIQQIQMERWSRVLEKRQDLLTDVLAELLAAVLSGLAAGLRPTRKAAKSMPMC